MLRVARIGLVLTVSLVLSAAAVAQTSAPASATVAPTSQPVDQSTPRGALKTFALAAREGNGGGIRAVLYPETEQEKAVAEIIASRVVATVQLQKAAARFPGQAVDPVEMDKAMATAFADIDAADVKIDGDRATLTTISREPGVPGSAIPLKLKDGKWGMVMSDMVKPLGGSPAEFEQRVIRAKIETDTITEIATEIAAGKYNAMDEAGRVLQTRVQTALLKIQAEQNKSATQPAATQATTKTTTP